MLPSRLGEHIATGEYSIIHSIRGRRFGNDPALNELPDGVPVLVLTVASAHDCGAGAKFEWGDLIYRQNEELVSGDCAQVHSAACPWAQESRPFDRDI